jgi:hypothetical protein
MRDQGKLTSPGFSIEMFNQDGTNMINNLTCSMSVHYIIQKH